MIKFIILTLFLSLNVQAQLSSQTQQTLMAMAAYDGAHTLALDGTIDSGIIYSKSNSWNTVKKEIRNQLIFTLGQLNGFKAVARLTNIKLSLVKKEIRKTYHRYIYSAKLEIVWPRDSNYPDQFNLILPERGDRSFINGPWYKTYGNLSNKNHQSLDCFDHKTNRIDTHNHWYHYRPNKMRCLLGNRQSGDNDYAVNFDINLIYSERNSQDKYPEYEKVWEDNTFKAITIFGSYKSSPEDNDAGKVAYEKYLNTLKNYLGEPDQYQGSFKDNKMFFTLRDGRRIEIHSFFTHDLKNESKQFIDSYNKSSTESDFIFYSGHASLGRNIEFLEKIGKFKQGQYQVYFISGCDTYAYMDDILQKRHASVNPGFEYSKHLEVISNAMPGYFHEGPRSALRFIEAFLQRRHSYREVLNRIDPDQKAGVIGEQDNRWPESF